LTLTGLLLLLIVANGAPLVASRLLGRRLASPVDGGCRWRDGRPLLGPSKTWRGLVVGALACAMLAVLLGYGFYFGLLYGVLALAGDLLSSFLKRRLGLAASARAIGLDQLPEAVLPMLMAWWVLGLGILQAALVVAVFALLNICLSPLLYRLGIRRQPH